MATYVQTVDIGHFAAADEREALTRDALTREVRRGLIARPRSLSPWMFYDAEGSRLFERITTLPEYYPTRTERAILAGHADAIIAAAHWDRSLPLRLVELGAGTASKTRILLEAAMRVSDDVAYVPVDVCPDALELACQNIAFALPGVRLQPIVRNYVTHPLQLESFDGTTLALYIGLQHLPDLALQVKTCRDGRRDHSFADGIVNHFVHCFVTRNLHSLGEFDQFLHRKFTFSNHRKQ